MFIHLAFKYESDFDENGLLYSLGTNEKRVIWQNTMLNKCKKLHCLSSDLMKNSSSINNIVWS